MNILAIYEIKTGDVLALCDDGYWYGSEPFKSGANSEACFDHVKAQDGNPAIWAVEKIREVFPGGRLQTYFANTSEEIVEDDGQPREY